MRISDWSSDVCSSDLEHLQIKLPVYFLVTGLERLHGYAQFRAALPAEAFSQALGFCLPESEVVNAATSGKLDETLDPIVERLHPLRETALRSQDPPATPRGVVADRTTGVEGKRGV